MVPAEVAGGPGADGGGPGVPALGRGVAGGLVDTDVDGVTATGLPHFTQNWASEGSGVPQPTQNWAAMDGTRRWEGYGPMGRSL